MDKLKVERSDNPVPGEQTLETTESRAEKSVVSMKPKKKGDPEFARKGDSGLRTDNRGLKRDECDLKKDKSDVRKDNCDARKDYSDLGADNSDLRKDNSCPSTANSDKVEHTFCAMDRGSEKKVIPPWTERFRPAQHSPAVKDSHSPRGGTTLVGTDHTPTSKTPSGPRQPRPSWAGGPSLTETLAEKDRLLSRSDQLSPGKDCPRTGDDRIFGKDRLSPAKVSPLHHKDISLSGTEKSPSGKDFVLAQKDRPAVEKDNPMSADDNPLTQTGTPSTGKDNIFPGKNSSFSATEEMLDSENQQRVEGLAHKVSRLRGIALELETDTKDSDRYAGGMLSDFGSAEGLLTGTMNRLNNMVNSGRNNRRLMCYIIVCLVGLFIIFYYLISRVTAS